MNTEKDVEAHKRQYVDQNVYFRLSVVRGLERWTSKDLGDIDTQTWSYLESEDTQNLIKKAVGRLGKNPASEDSELLNRKSISSG
jgi:hypothetical protein